MAGDGHHPSRPEEFPNNYVADNRAYVRLDRFLRCRTVSRRPGNGFDRIKKKPIRTADGSVNDERRGHRDGNTWERNRRAGIVGYRNRTNVARWKTAREPLAAGVRGFDTTLDGVRTGPEGEPKRNIRSLSPVDTGSSHCLRKNNNVAGRKGFPQNVSPEFRRTQFSVTPSAVVLRSLSRYCVRSIKRDSSSYQLHT